MVQCPTCSKKMPDNLRFCGFCGIELRTGREQTVDRWLAYIHTTLVVNAERLSDIGNRIIASVALIAGSLVTLVTNFSFDSILLWILGLLGLLVGVTCFWLFTSASQGLSTLCTILDIASVLALAGKLVTSQDFNHFIGQSRERAKHRMKLVDAVSESLGRDIFGDEENGQPG